ncbi:MAG: DeoR/GlpR transcriptional regulator [Ruminococcaceae bacterium]|nr:DeoR/GlpR transcriptional regulator [Oscillospiraceae bacterium]
MYNERRERIRALLTEKPFISIKELQSMFPDVSGMTLRRDIEFFESQGEAIKVRGGARSMKFITTSTDDAITTRMQENVASKEKIARRAAEFLETGRSIFIDSGSTLQRIVPYVPNERFTFTTTNPMAALELCKIGLPAVNIVGGKLDRDYQTVTGMHAMRFLSDINIDIAFLSPSGLSLKSGFTGGNYSECELKRVVVDKARLVVLLLDASKIDKSLPYTFCHLDQVHIIITDAPLPEDIAREAKRLGVRVLDVREDLD